MKSIKLLLCSPILSLAAVSGTLKVVNNTLCTLNLHEGVLAQNEYLDITKTKPGEYSIAYDHGQSGVVREFYLPISIQCGSKISYFSTGLKIIGASSGLVFWSDAAENLPEYRLMVLGDLRVDTYNQTVTLLLAPQKAKK